MPDRDNGGACFVGDRSEAGEYLARFVGAVNVDPGSDVGDERINNDEIGTQNACPMHQKVEALVVEGIDILGGVDAVNVGSHVVESRTDCIVESVFGGHD